jgi:trigger factor
MVPLNLLKKMYGKSILAEEINNILSEGLYNYIKDNNIDLLGEPLPNETEQKEIDFDNQESFEFVFDIALPPAFEVELTKKDKIKYYQSTPDDTMIENQVKSYAGRFGKYEQEETVEEQDMLKGLLVELENGEEKADGIRVENAVLTPAYMKDEAIKTVFVGAKKEGEVIFNPKQAYENEAEVASLLKMKKEEVENLTSDFKYTIQSITRYHEAAVDQDLFDKVFGEGTVKSEKEFKEKIKENIAENLLQDSNYKFGLDVREFLVKKYKDLSFPDAFLKRWLLRTNKDMTEERVEADYPKMKEDLTWQLIRNKIAKAHDVKIEKEDVEAYAKKIARSQFAQYGIPNADDQMIEPYVQEMLQNENQLNAIIDRVTENKVVDIIKEAVKLDVKEVSIEEFNKMFEK